MLYHRWQSISSQYADTTAVTHHGTSMTFGEIARAVDSAPKACDPVIARADGPGFFIDILRAWRDGQAAIPIEKNASPPLLARRPPHGVALVKHTPGAGGIPRGIFFTEAALASEADRLTSVMALTPDSPNLSVISLTHSYGFGNIVLPFLLHGIPVVWLDVPFPRIVEAALTRHPPLTIAAVPSIWRAWHRSNILTSATIRLAISAGSPLPIELEHDIHQASRLKIHNLYGTSETGAISWDANEHPREHASEVGTPLPGVRASIDSACQRIRVESGALACGYDHARPGDSLERGFHLTHDLGCLDALGRLHIQGTLDGAINVAGRKVSPEKVRQALLASGMLADARITPAPSADPDRHQEIHAHITWKSGVQPDLDALKQNLTSTLTPWEIPRQWTTHPA